jgi:hypothetical protein
MNRIKAAIFGFLIAISGTFLQNAYRPFGLLISLASLALGFILVKRMYQTRSCTIVYSVAWVIVVIRASTLGNGGELLIQFNSMGNLYALGGTILLIIMLISSHRER